MNKAAVRFNRDDYMAKAKDIFEAAGKAQMKHYQSYSGMKYDECPGAYNDYMVRAMAHDMVSACIALKDAPFGKRLQSWMPKMTALNTEIMRMVDDLKGDRPVKGQNINKWNKFRAEIEDIMQAPEVQNSPYSDLKDKMKIWDERLAYQIAWIYYLRESHAINFTEMQLGCRQDGSDVSPMTGLMEAEEAEVKDMLETRKILLRTYLKLPVDTPEHDRCREMLEGLAMGVNTIMKHTADDFRDADEPEESETEDSGQDSNPPIGSFGGFGSFSEDGGDGQTPDQEESDSVSGSEISDILTAIQTVAEDIKGRMDPDYKPKEISLRDRIVTCRMVLSRLEKHMDERDDIFINTAKLTSKMMKSLADDLEMEAILS